jgi:pyruvate dehydrogenase E1 component alpha subunit
MLTIRHFEERPRPTILSARSTTSCTVNIGEEAVAIGICTALDRGDRIISTHRGHGHCIAKRPTPTG